MPASKHHPGPFWKDALRVVLFTLLAVVLAKFFFIEAFRVPTPSMANTLLPGDFIITDKFLLSGETLRYIPFTDIKIPPLPLPVFRHPERGDVVVFRFPGVRADEANLEGDIYVKRLTGMPGDTLELVEGRLLINHVAVPLPPAAIPGSTLNTKGKPDDRIFPNGKPWNEDFYGPVYIPRRGDSLELTLENYLLYKPLIEAESGKAPLSAERGKIFLAGKETACWKFAGDAYFVLGDNRGESYDSRFWGLVPRNTILGKVWFVYWSVDPFANGPLSGIRSERIGKRIN